MAMFSFNTGDPKLYIGNKTYKKINILSKLYELHQEGKDKYRLYERACLFYQNPNIPILDIKLGPNAVMPTKSIEDVGYDLTIVSVKEKKSNKTTVYDTEVALHLPLGYYAQVHLRSSMSKYGYILSNGTGIIDPGYTGSIRLSLTKIDEELPDIEVPFRCAQIVIQPYVNCDVRQVDDEHNTNRGDNGFGSTG